MATRTPKHSVLLHCTACDGGHHSPSLICTTHTPLPLGASRGANLGTTEIPTNRNLVVKSFFNLKILCYLSAVIFCVNDLKLENYI
jgi:hypothetical protein